MFIAPLASALLAKFLTLFSSQDTSFLPVDSWVWKMTFLDTKNSVTLTITTKP
jgi:hypothetical protein